MRHYVQNVRATVQNCVARPEPFRMTITVQVVHVIPVNILLGDLAFPYQLASTHVFPKNFPHTINPLGNLMFWSEHPQAFGEFLRNEYLRRGFSDHAKEATRKPCSSFVLWNA